MRIILSLMFLLISPLVFAANTSSEDSKKVAMLQDLDVMKNYLSVKYAPKAWKQSLLGWDLGEAYSFARERIISQKSPSAKTFRRIFKEFVGTTEDYHVKSVFYSTATAIFPFTIKSAEGRYFITGNEMSIEFVQEESLFIFEDIQLTDEEIAAVMRILPGDELIAMNGIPIKTVMEGIIENKLTGDYTATGCALAEKMVFKHLGKYGDEVPSGSFEVTILHKGEKTPNTYKFRWFHYPELMKDQDHQMMKKDHLAQFSFGQMDNHKKQLLISSVNKSLDKDFTVGIAKDYHMNLKGMRKASSAEEENDDDDDDEDEDEREKGYLPPLGEIIWETDTKKELYGYLYENSHGQKVGYMYIPSFSPDQDPNAAIQEMIDFLKRVDEEGEVLVIDITSNPGGGVWFMYAVLSLLTDTPLKVPAHEEILIPEDVYNAFVISKTLESIPEEMPPEEQTVQGYVINNTLLKNMKEYAQSIVNAWESGKLMTPPIYLNGLAEVLPHPRMQFSKPIVVLTDALDFSCADFFPAILQDNKKATIFGQRTAGAGGYVVYFPHTSRFGVKGFTLTGSIAYRIDGNPVENLGVTPDVPYKLTVRDIQENYVDYIQALDNVLLKAVK